MIIGELLRIKGTRSILKVRANDSIAQAATMMTENKVGALLVGRDRGHTFRTGYCRWYGPAWC